MEGSEKDDKRASTGLDLARSLLYQRRKLYLKDLLRSLFHARPDLVPETPQCVEFQDGVDALTRLLMMQLRHHHFCDGVGDLHSAQEEHSSWRGKEQGQSHDSKPMSELNKSK